MEDTSMRINADITFHTFLPWFLIRLASLLMPGALCLGLALHHHSLWWAGVLVAAWLAGALSARYAAEAVILRSTYIVIREGVLPIYERYVPLEEVALDIHQSLLGRVFDYGTIRQQLGSRTITVRDVAEVRALHLLLAERQRYLAPQLHPYQQCIVPYRLLPALHVPPSLPTVQRSSHSELPLRRG